MKKNWTAGFSFPIALILLFALIPATLGDSDSLSPSVDVPNEYPNIIYMATDQASYDPTEAGNTYVEVTINVSDPNGVDDLEVSSLKLEVDDTSPFTTAVVKYTNTTCMFLTDVSATVRSFRCSATMNFWDSAGTYSTKISIKDTGDLATYNDTSTNAPTWTYTTLEASNVSTTSIAWSSVLVGVLNQASDINPLVIANRGNAQLKLNITGADLTPTGLYAGNFSVDLDNNATNGEQVLTTSSAQIVVDSQDATVLQGSDGTPSPVEQLYFWVDIPIGTPSDSYTGSWTLYEYEG
jgi:hypothetical protein